MVYLAANSPLETTYARQLAVLEGDLALSLGSEEPESGFAEWAAAVVHSATPNYSVPDWSLVPDHRWTESPILSAYGYRLALVGDAPWTDRWRYGLQRLMGRDPAPPDRNSFFFRPFELLGLAVGVAAMRTTDGEPVNWLSDVIQRHSERNLPSSPWAGALATLAAKFVDQRTSPVRLDLSSSRELALALWLDQAGHGGDVLSETVDRPALERQLLVDALLREPALHGVAERMIYWLSLRLALVTALDAPNSDSASGTVIQLCRRFPLFARELETRHGGRAGREVRDEYDVQDLLRAILRLHFDDVRTEEWNPSYGAVGSRSDLLLKAQRLIIEVKMTRASLSRKDLVAQLIVDKAQYRTHPDCGTLVCFIFDPEFRLSNPEALEQDLSEADGEFPVHVIVSPQGL